MDELIARVTQALGIDAGVAQQAIGAILAFVQKEAPAADVEKLFQALPGAEKAIELAPAAGGGLMGALGGLMGGSGGLMGLAAQLQGLGLGMGEIQTLGEQVFTYAREQAGDDTVREIASSIPGLDRFV
jgi:hypothetical protein